MSNSVHGPSSGRRFMKTLTSTLAASALIAGGVLATSPAYAAPAIDGNGVQTDLTAGRYVVTLADDAAAVYDGGVAGLAPTEPSAGRQLKSDSSAVTKYSDYLEGQQKAVADSVGAKIEYNYTKVLNGFGASLTAAQAASLRTDKRVVSIEKNEIQHVDAVPSTEFLGLSGDGGVWDRLGGIDAAGDGVVVGVVDTGIAPENPSFAGDALGTTPGAAPYLAGDTITYAKSDGGTFTGICEPGEAGGQFDGTECNTKIVGARYYVDGFGADQIGSPDVNGEYLSPRDGDSHGSHTASTAAGNNDVPTTVSGVDRGPISGVAPAAKISVYKACWSGPDPDPFVTDDDGCATLDTLAAIDQAVADNVDVINFSIGGGAATSVVTATDLAFFNAAAAGIFVAVSAGNDGPAASTVDHASPWYTSVAASTIPSYEATATFSSGEAFPGASITVSDDLTGELVFAGDIGVAGAVTPNLCLPGTLDPALAAGKIVVCERGNNARVEKSSVAADAGAIGVILVNVVTGSLDLDEHVIPTVHIQADFHDQVVALARTAGETATLSNGNSTDIVTPTPQLAGFSSRGPATADDGDVLKPDIAAPGVAILAAGANAEGADPTYEFLSGTSMASPHIAGLAALYLSEKPTATPAEIKSAMMTTADNTVDDTGAPVTDVFGQGAGQVDPPSMFEPGLVYLNGPDDWKSYIQGAGYDWPEAPGEPEVQPIDPSDLNLASIAIGSLVGSQTVTRTVTATEGGTYSASVEGLEGIGVTVSPETFTIAAGATATYTVTFTASGAAYDEYATGYLSWKSSSTTVRSPVAVKPVLLSAPAVVQGTGITGSVDVDVASGVTGDIPLTASTLAPNVLLPDPAGGDPAHSGSGVDGDDVLFPITVPEGASLLRVDLDSIDDAADLDLFVFLLDADGNPVGSVQSATEASDERVTLLDPPAGDWLIQVNVYSAPGTAAFDVRTAIVAPGGPALTVAPNPVPAVLGETATYTASWADLTPESEFFGVVGYGETGLSTIVDITTGEAAPTTVVNTAPPTISGTPSVGKKLTADPGTWEPTDATFAYQWQRNGVDIPGATKATYKLKKADAGAAITVVVTASAEGLLPGTATSAPVTVLLPSTTSVSLSRFIGFSWQTTSATAKVTAGTTPPTGTAQLIVDGKKVGAPTALAADGTVKLTVPKLRSGVHEVKIAYSGSETVEASTSSTKYLIILF